MAEEDDLITIVDVTDPDDPSYADVKTRRRPLSDAELATLKPILEKVGAYKFFSMEFNFADGPAVKQFIESVELEEFKRTKQRKIVQDTMKGMVAGREVLIDSELIEKAFGLVDDGENISKPKGETNGLHAFYIKPKYIPLCQNYRGVYLKLFKSEYSYFVNLAHQIQTYCCGGQAERQITLTQYRAIDLMIRGKPVNWNRYLLQNFQDKLRKYKAGPCSLYFGGTLTALIYKALQVDYNLVNKPLLISPQTPERITASDGERSSKKRDKRIKDSGPPKKRELARRQVGAVTRAQRILASESLASESLETENDPPVTRTSGRSSAAVKALQDRKRKRVKQKVKMAASNKRQHTSSAKQKRTHEIESEPSVMENDEEEEEEEEDAADGGTDDDDDMPSSPPTSAAATAAAATITPYTKGSLRKRMADVERLGGGEIVLSTRTNRLSKLFSQATGSPSPIDSDQTVALTASKDLWAKYDHFYSLQHEYQLEHIVSKQMLEQSLQRIQELEDALKEKDQRVIELEEQLGKNNSNRLTYTEDGGAPLKIRLKVGQKKVSAPEEEQDPSSAAQDTTQEEAEAQAQDHDVQQQTKGDDHQEQAAEQEQEQQQQQENVDKQDDGPPENKTDISDKQVEKMGAECPKPDA